MHNASVIYLVLLASVHNAFLQLAGLALEFQKHNVDVLLINEHYDFDIDVQSLGSSTQPVSDEFTVHLGNQLLHNESALYISDGASIHFLA